MERSSTEKMRIHIWKVGVTRDEQFHQIYCSLIYRPRKFKFISKAKSHEFHNQNLLLRWQHSHISLCITVTLPYTKIKYTKRLQTFTLRNIKMYYLLNKGKGWVKNLGCLRYDQNKSASSIYLLNNFKARKYRFFLALKV